jgi:hypothetical protein
MAIDRTRIGLRLLEFETGVASNIDDTNSAELVDYYASRTAGQAARLAMLIRGQDVIEDQTKLKKIAALELGMTVPEFAAAKRFLEDADLVEDKVTRTGKPVLVEKVERLNHAENYRRVGDLWLVGKDHSQKEEAIIHALDQVVSSPAELNTVDPLRQLPPSDRNAVLEVGGNAGILEVIQDRQILYTPLLWDVNPKKLAEFLKAANRTAFQQVVSTIRAKAGTDVTTTMDSVVLQAIQGGILPSYRVNSTAGERIYSFAPYLGSLLASDEEKTILDKARAIVASLRYGNEAATITRIRQPILILNKLTDASRSYRIGPHSELKQQYGMLVSKQIGRVIAARNGRYYFELIPSKDNLRACRIAAELITTGENVGEKDPGTDAAILLVSGTITHPLREVRVAKRKRSARADELADLVDQLRSFG